MKLNLRNEKGITLIALIITVIIMVILAAISINSIYNMAIVDKATKGVQDYASESVKENQIIQISENTIQNTLKELDTIYQRLPSQYQQVEYIESTGTQWIDTEKRLGYNNSFVMKLNASYMPRTLFGKNSNGYECFFGGRDVYLNGRGLSLNLLTNTWYNIVFDTTDGNAKFYVDDELILESKGKNNHGKVYLFGGCNEYSSYDIDNFAKYKLESFKTYNDGTLEQELIPCYRKSDNEIGMYDVVEGKFYINQGTGEFIAGPEV